MNRVFLDRIFGFRFHFDLFDTLEKIGFDTISSFKHQKTTQSMTSGCYGKLPYMIMANCQIAKYYHGKLPNIIMASCQTLSWQAAI